ncbi:MAG: tetratricopeptide repeat protein [Lentimicrobium sp.]|nr:tetratricopeptide repeat protein [Lentimicrobium sp.]
MAILFFAIQEITMKKKEKNKIDFHRSTDSEFITLPGNLKIRMHVAAILLILVFTFLLFSGSLQNNFLFGWDDGEYLSDPSVSGDGPIPAVIIFSNFHLGMYQPLAVLSFALNYKISGPSAYAFILTNILLHLLNTLLVFRLMHRWMKGWIPAGIVALLFAIHPMHVESVVWISTRSSALYSLFYLAGLLAWDNYLEKGLQPKYYLLALLFATLSLFSKSMAATFPLILLVMDYLKNRKFSLRIITDKIPFLVLSAIFGIVGIKASVSFGHITVLEQEYNLFQRFFLIFHGIAFYLYKLIIPTNLSAIYAFPELNSGQIPASVFLSVIVCMAFAAGIWFSGRYRKGFTVGALFFLISISMVLPLFWSRIFITADRYTYIPYIGLFMIIAMPVTDLWNSRKTLDQSTLRMFYIASGLILILLSTATYRRIGVWKDTPTLLTNVIDKKRSNSDMAHGYFYLANYYDAASKTEEAMKYYDLALSRNNKYLLALNNRGILKGKAGNIRSAITDFEQAIQIKPDYAEAYYNRGVALYQMNDKALACEDWKKALVLGFKPAAQAINQYCGKSKMPDFRQVESIADSLNRKRPES